MLTVRDSSVDALFNSGYAVYQIQRGGSALAASEGYFLLDVKCILSKIGKLVDNPEMHIPTIVNGMRLRIEGHE